MHIHAFVDHMPSGVDNARFMNLLTRGPVVLLYAWVMHVLTRGPVVLLYKKGKFLYSAVSSPQDRSKRFTLYFPDRHVHSDTISASLGSRDGVFMHIHACVDQGPCSVA